MLRCQLTSRTAYLMMTLTRRTAQLSLAPPSSEISLLAPSRTPESANACTECVVSSGFFRAGFSSSRKALTGIRVLLHLLQYICSSELKSYEGMKLRTVKMSKGRDLLDSTIAGHHVVHPLAAGPSTTVSCALSHRHISNRRDAPTRLPPSPSTSAGCRRCRQLGRLHHGIS